jgi:hypothetical protein
MLRVLVYCVLFALVPVVAWFAARNVSRFERRMVGTVMLVVPWGLIVFVMLVWTPGHRGGTQTISTVDDAGAPGVAALGLPALPGATALPAAPGGTSQALGGQPEPRSGTRPGSTTDLTSGIVPVIPNVQPGTTIGPPAAISATDPLLPTSPLLVTGPTAATEAPAPTTTAAGAPTTISPPVGSTPPTPATQPAPPTTTTNAPAPTTQPPVTTTTNPPVTTTTTPVKTPTTSAAPATTLGGTPPATVTA